MWASEVALVRDRWYRIGGMEAHTHAAAISRREYLKVGIRKGREERAVLNYSGNLIVRLNSLVVL